MKINTLPLSLPWWLRRERTCLQCRRPCFSPWVGKTPWKRNGSPLQYSRLENFLHRGVWWAIQSMGSQNRTQLSDSHFDFSSLSLSYACPLHRGSHCVINTGNNHCDQFLVQLFKLQSTEAQISQIQLVRWANTCTTVVNSNLCLHHKVAFQNMHFKS